MANILVTGVSGFVGREVVANLLNEGHRVLGISRTDVSFPLEYTHLPCDLSSIDDHLQTIAQFEPDTLIHCAWQGLPDYSIDQSLRNISLTVSLFERVLSLGVLRIIGIGTCWEYDVRSGSCHENDIVVGSDDFTWAKLSIHDWLKIQATLRSFDYSWLRLFYVYGPGQRSNSLIPLVISNAKVGRTTILRSPFDCCDFIHVKDVAAGIVRSIPGPEGGSKTINIASGNAYPNHAIQRKVLGIMGKEQLMPNYDLTDDRRTAFWGNIEIAKNSIGWAPSMSIDDGLAEVVSILWQPSDREKVRNDFI